MIVSLFGQKYNRRFSIVQANENESNSTAWYSRPPGNDGSMATKCNLNKIDQWMDTTEVVCGDLR